MILIIILNYYIVLKLVKRFRIWKININNFNENNFQNNININQNYQNNNNQIPKPEYVIPPGLDSSSHENSIVGEK
jgi:hypothetical protein